MQQDDTMESQKTTISMDILRRISDNKIKHDVKSTEYTSTLYFNRVFKHHDAVEYLQGWSQFNIHYLYNVSLC